MENRKNNQLTVVDRQSTSLTVSSDEKELAVILLQVNDLIAYPRQPTELVMWSQKLLKLIPDLDKEALNFLFEQFALENLEWDDKKGIQNLIYGLKKVSKVKGVYQLKTSLSPW